MNISDFDAILKKALGAWGNESQEIMAIEECSELIKAICKNQRKNDLQRIKDIQDEVADVVIMMRQMQLIFGEKEINDRIVFKISRLENKLKSIK